MPDTAVPTEADAWTQLLEVEPGLFARKRTLGQFLTGFHQNVVTKNAGLVGAYAETDALSHRVQAVAKMAGEARADGNLLKGQALIVTAAQLALLFKPYRSDFTYSNTWLRTSDLTVLMKEWLAVPPLAWCKVSLLHRVINTLQEHDADWGYAYDQNGEG